MKVIRNGVFETNSSTTHSLVLFSQIKACGLEIDFSKDVTITLIPLCDSRNNEWQEKAVNSLNHVSYMVDYIYTILMSAKYWVENKKTTQEWLIDLANKSTELIDKMQQYLVDLGYTINYKQPLVLNEDLDRYDKIHIEHNDGTAFEYVEDIEEMLETIDSFRDYIEKHTWVIAYNG